MARHWPTRRRLIVAAVSLLAIALVWWFSAYPRGMIAAWADGFREHEEIQVYGEPWSADQEYARLLRERYGVKFNVVATCVVTQDLVSYADGYNAISKPRIRNRFGKDIFAECAADAEAAWEQEHGKQ